MFGNMCRCCLARPPDKALKTSYTYLGASEIYARPPDKALKTSYTYLGASEIYADMLKDCFEIHLSIGVVESDGGICEICVTRLRDAHDFKQQVQRCQKEFQNCAVNAKGEVLKVKEEVSDNEDNDLIVFELKEELDDFDGFKSEDDTKLAEIFGLNDVTVKRKTMDKKKKKLLDKNSDRKSQGLYKKPVKLSLRNIDKHGKTKSLPILKCIDENVKHKTNLNNILRNSNCTPFLNKTLSGIVCAYCKKVYPNVTELRNHVNDKHKVEELNEDKKRDKNNLSIKLDISDLICTVCNKNFDVITNLKKHLTVDHNIKFYADIKNYIMEFKLTDSDILKCALCNSTFETFKMLLQHMNGHYRNYICDTCDCGFINKHRLRNHQRTHETGTFKCSFCEKVFTTRVRMTCHEKYTHNTSARYTTNCPQCDKSFTSYYQRNRHMFQEHNTAAATYKCNICDKSFILKSKLTSHIKKVHLMERNHICSECGQGFFIKQSLDEHMIKHNGERVYKCNVCLKAYARKKTLREHMRIHNNDRRFKCGVCGLTFVQKCSLKSHMLSNHGVTLSEFENSA